MPHDRLSGEEIEGRGTEIYQRLRPQLEGKHDGKICMIDVETGDYEIGDRSLEAAGRLRQRHPDGAFWAERVGYDAVYALGGTLTRASK